ncbi:hypothetical protein FIBSPDRAFT_857440, partial [Athelia psychrophila]
MPVQGGINPLSLLVVAISVPPQPARTHHAPREHDWRGQQPRERSSHRAAHRTQRLAHHPRRLRAHIHTHAPHAPKRRATGE